MDSAEVKGGEKEKTAKLKIGAYLNRFCFCFHSFLCNSSRSESCFLKNRGCHSNLQSLIDLFLVYKWVCCLLSFPWVFFLLMFSTNSLAVIGLQETFNALYVFQNVCVWRTLTSTSSYFNEYSLLVFYSCFFPSSTSSCVLMIICFSDYSTSLPC